MIKIQIIEMNEGTRNRKEYILLNLNIEVTLNNRGST